MRSKFKTPWHRFDWGGNPRYGFKNWYLFFVRPWFRKDDCWVKMDGTRVYRHRWQRWIFKIK
jgi:hypothetical protein